MATTLIRNADFVIAWDAAANSHVYMPGLVNIHSHPSSAGRLLTIDYPAAAEALHEAQKRVMANVPKLDWAHRNVDELSPMTFRTA